MSFSTTTRTRHDESQHPRWVARWRGKFGPDSREFRTAEEHAHWSFDHRVGIVDLGARKVWLRPGHWRNVSWAPARVTAS